MPIRPRPRMPNVLPDMREMSGDSIRDQVAGGEWRCVSLYSAIPRRRERIRASAWSATSQVP